MWFIPVYKFHSVIDFSFYSNVHLRIKFVCSHFLSIYSDFFWVDTVCPRECHFPHNLLWLDVMCYWFEAYFGLRLLKSSISLLIFCLVAWHLIERVILQNSMVFIKLSVSVLNSDMNTLFPMLTARWQALFRIKYWLTKARQGKKFSVLTLNPGWS